jgi:O-antigen ligase
MALAALILIGFMLNGTFKRDLSHKLLVPSFALILLAGIIATGSRSAASAFIIGCIVYLLPRWSSRRVITSVLLASFGIGAVLYMTVKSPYFVERWEATYYDQEWSGRQDIYGAAFEMISEEPLLGWGPTGAFYELGRRLRSVVDGREAGRDVHNLFLDLIITVGILGAIPFLLGLFECLRAAWRARLGAFGIFPMALIATNLVASVAHTNLTWKAQWFVFALAFAASAPILVRQYSPKVHLAHRRATHTSRRGLRSG